jgi:hypothetical protein
MKGALMAQKLTPAQHRYAALELLEKAQTYAVSPTSARPVIIAEALVHATLAMTAPEPVQTVTVTVGDVSETTTRPAPKPRTRKPAATAAEKDPEA